MNTPRPFCEGGQQPRLHSVFEKHGDGDALTLNWRFRHKKIGTICLELLIRNKTSSCHIE